MSLKNPNSAVTEERLKEFYNTILPYLGGSADAGFTPVGTIISVMGVTAPANYLACDGTVYNIADYPELANYFYQQFGSKNKFGGNGTTTFAVPDLKGEFLRGTGNNSHSDGGNGGAVGEHQKATQFPMHGTTPSTQATGYVPTMNTYLGYDSSDKPLASFAINYVDRNISRTNLAVVKRASISADAMEVGSTSVTSDCVTARPTNTSVLFCIATKNIYLNPSLDYSTDEKVVGTWIDGKPLYQKTVTATLAAVSSSTRKWTTVYSENNVNYDMIMLDEGASFTYYVDGDWKYVVPFSDVTQSNETYASSYKAWHIGLNSSEHQMNFAILTYGQSIPTNKETTYCLTFKYTKT